MRVGISFGCYAGLSVEKNVELMRANGVTATFTGSESEQLPEIMAALDGTGIVCDSLHAPFRGTPLYPVEMNAIWEADASGDMMLARLIDGVDRCARYGVPTLVVHLSGGQNPPPVTDAGVARWRRLMAHADACGVKIAFENQRMLSNLAFAMEEFPSAVFCWDAGHENCFTPGRRYMPLFGNRLGYLHLHDNRRQYNKDLHMIPGDGLIDFDYIVDAIAATDYPGSVMLEIISDKSPDYVNVSPEDYFCRAAAAGHRLAAAIEARRAQKN